MCLWLCLHRVLAIFNNIMIHFRTNVAIVDNPLSRWIVEVDVPVTMNECSIGRQVKVRRYY